MALTTVVDGGRTVLDAEQVTEDPANHIQGAESLGSYVSSGTLSVAFWMRATAAPGSFDAPLSSSPDSNWAGGLIAYWSGATTFRFGFNRWNVGQLEAGISIPSDWHSIVATHDGSDARLYLDGALADTELGATLSPGSNPLMLYTAPGNAPAAEQAPTWQYQFVGRLDAINVYDRVLTPGEIAAIAGERGAGPNGLPIDAINTYRSLVGNAPIPTYGDDDGEILTIAAPDRAVSVRAERSISTQADRHTTIATPDRRIQVLQ